MTGARGHRKIPPFPLKKGFHLSINPFPGLKNRDIPEDVEVHEHEETVCLRRVLRGRGEASPERRLCLPDGVHHVGLRRPEGLQPHADRRPAGQQGLRHCHPER